MKRYRWTMAALALVALATLGGCASRSMSLYQDGRTLIDKHIELGLGVCGVAEYQWRVRPKERIGFQTYEVQTDVRQMTASEVFLRVGILPNLDVYGKSWSRDFAFAGDGGEAGLKFMAVDTYGFALSLLGGYWYGGATEEELHGESDLKVDALASGGRLAMPMSWHPEQTVSVYLAPFAELDLLEYEFTEQGRALSPDPNTVIDIGFQGERETRIVGTTLGVRFHGRRLALYIEGTWTYILDDTLSEEKGHSIFYPALGLSLSY